MRLDIARDYTPHERQTPADLGPGTPPSTATQPCNPALQPRPATQPGPLRLKLSKQRASLYIASASRHLRRLTISRACGCWNLPHSQKLTSAA